MRVLIATDGSKGAERAIELAGSLEWPEGTELRVCAVLQPVEPIIGADWAQQEDAEELSKATLDPAAESLSHTGLNISQALMRGRPASKLVEAAEDLNADLIIVGSRGHGTIASMVLGSVSAEVSDHAPCPVLVARTPVLTHAILGLDGSISARGAEDIVATWPIFETIPIEITTVGPMGLPWTSGLALSAAEPQVGEVGETMDALATEPRGVGEAAAARLRAAGRHVSARVINGAPATELIRFAEDQQADLIVVGTHGRTGLARALMGSVARNVMLHAPCSVLVIRETVSRAMQSAA